MTNWHKIKSSEVLQYLDFAREPLLSCQKTIEIIDAKNKYLWDFDHPSNKYYLLWLEDLNHNKIMSIIAHLSSAQWKIAKLVFIETHFSGTISAAQIIQREIGEGNTSFRVLSYFVKVIGNLWELDSHFSATIWNLINIILSWHPQS